MKAVVFDNHGGLEGIGWREWPDPEVQADEVKVRIHAAAFNGFDPMVLKGIPTLKTPLPMIPGGDMAGEVVEIGSGVPAGEWKIGDRVMVMPLQRKGLMGETLRGGFCEFVSVQHQYLVRLPDEVSYVDAAALPIAYGTAHRMMMTRGKVAAGDRVLILGATGGVGTCCVQLAKLAGAEVAACTSSSAKAAQLKAIGADHVINTSEQDFVQETVRLWGKPKVFGEGGGGADIAVNFIGGPSWAKSLRTVRRDGRLMTCGATDGYDPQTDIRYIWSFELNIIGSNGWTVNDLRALLGLVAAGRLKPIIHSLRRMHEAKLSMGELIERKVFGKAILVP